MASLVEIIVTAEDRASGALRGIGGALSGIGRVATGAALAGIGRVANGFVLAGTRAVSMNAELETSTLQFETLMGDADAAAEHVQGLFDFAAKTPFETGPIIAASRQMRVFGGDALDTQDNLTRVGDTAAAVGAPIEDISFWVGRAYAAIQGGQPFGEAAQNLMQMGAVSPDVIAEMNRLADSGASADDVFGVLQDHMDGFSGAMEKQAGTWEGLKATISDSLNMMAANALKPFFELAKEGMAGLATWLNSPEVQAGIQRIAQGFTQLIERVADFVTNQVIPFVTTHGQQLKEALIAIGVALGAFMIIGTIIGLVTALTNPITLIAGAIGVLAAAWTNNWGGIRDKTLAVINFIRPLVEQFLAAIQTFWAEHGAAIMATVQQVWQTIQTVISTVITIISTIVQTVLAAIQTFWAEHGAAILATATQFWNLIKGLIDGVVNQIKLIIDAFRLAFEGDWRGFGEKIFEIWENAWNTVVDFLSGLWDMVLPWLKSLWENVRNWFVNTDWPALGRQIVQGIINGLRAMGGALGDVLQGIVDAAIRRIKQILGIASPSKLMDYYGRMTGAGLVEGIASQVPAVQRAVEGLLDAADLGNVAVGLSSGSLGAGRAGGGTLVGGSRTTVINIDARGAQRGVDRDLRAMVEQVLREQGRAGDVRLRTT